MPSLSLSKFITTSGSEDESPPQPIRKLSKNSKTIFFDVTVKVLVGTLHLLKFIFNLFIILLFFSKNVQIS
jgi:hypothetical protein